MLYIKAPGVRFSTFDYPTIDQFNTLKLYVSSIPSTHFCEFKMSYQHIELEALLIEVENPNFIPCPKQLLDILFGKFKALRISYHAEKDERKKLEVKLQISTCKKRIDKAIEELTAYQTTAGKKWDKLGDSETVSPKVIEAAQISPYTIESENAFRDRAALETSKEIILSTQAYLGRRHDEYASQLAAEPPTEPTKKAYAWHETQSLSRYHSSARKTRATALLHWAAVSKARREERINGYNTLHRRATEQGEPRRTSGFRTSLRASLFEPLGPPDLAGAGAGRKWRAQAQEAVDAGQYREATLANLAQLRPRLDLTLLAFSFNEDALRLYGGLVGGAPRARDLARMDRILRELEVYVAVCAHRRKLVVGHLKRTRQFPVLVPAQFGDLQAACGDAEEDQLAVSRRYSEYVAGRSRSRYVMTYEGKRRRRDVTGQLAEEDYEKLNYLKKIDDEAERLCSELDAAGEWLTWCRHMKEHWALGWRPDRVEKDMLYVGEDTQSDVRRYKREINEKRAALGLVPVARPQDEVYERQQEQIRLLDGIWNLMA
ncbi:hypothetical protein N8I77_000490 [Diaporthe amygdali]|uniref:Uncharacterized protein n=1 Tax=Phomopsis amygdali TaxID=1214568 RepID=A0AAD9SPV9_PHOAM|nr:hypothetical protein N8I77_000490 [Diaporthe amygdali]